MKLRVALTLTAGILPLAVLAGCSDSSSGDTATGTSGGNKAATVAALEKYTQKPTTLPLDTPLSKPAPEDVKVAFLQNGQTPGQQFSAALQAAATTMGWTEKDVPFDAANPAAIGSAFQTAVNSGAKVIVTQGLDSALYAKFVPLAQAKDVVVIDTVTSGKTVPGVTYVDRSTAAGKSVSEIAVATVMADAKQRGITPHLLNISSVLFRSILTPTNDAIAAGIKAADCGDCSADVFELSPQATLSNAVAAPVVSYLQAHPQVNYLFTSNGALSTGLLSAIKQAGLGTKIRLVGATPLPPQIEELKAGSPQTLGWIANSISVVAWMSIDASARVLVGDDASAYADLAAPTWLLTHDSGADLVPAPVAPTDFAKQYAALWKRS